MYKVFKWLALVLLLTSSMITAAEAATPADSGVQGGLVVAVGFEDEDELAALGAGDGYVVQGIDTNAAKVDGAGTWTIYRRIILPLSVIPFVVASLLQVTIIWNDYIWGLVLTTGVDNLPVTVAMANLKGSFVAEWNLQMSGALWIAVPTLVIFILLGKYIIRGYSGK